MGLSHCFPANSNKLDERNGHGDYKEDYQVPRAALRLGSIEGLSQSPQHMGRTSHPESEYFTLSWSSPQHLLLRAILISWPMCRKVTPSHLNLRS